MSVQAEIRRFVVENFLLTGDDPGLSDGDSLTELGILDSTGALELVMHLEGSYGITVLDEELHPDNLDSIEKITSFVERKRVGGVNQPDHPQ